MVSRWAQFGAGSKRHRLDVGVRVHIFWILWRIGSLGESLLEFGRCGFSVDRVLWGGFAVRCVFRSGHSVGVLMLGFHGELWLCFEVQSDVKFRVESVSRFFAFASFWACGEAKRAGRARSPARSPRAAGLRVSCGESRRPGGGAAEAATSRSRPATRPAAPAPPRRDRPPPRAPRQAQTLGFAGRSGFWGLRDRQNRATAGRDCRNHAASRLRYGDCLRLPEPAHQSTRYTNYQPQPRV